jgi:uncharacterized protein
VHPESYEVVESMAKTMKATVAELIRQPDLRKKLKANDFVNDKVGQYTIEDIMKELEKPGRDPRSPIEEFRFADGVSTMADLKPGMKIPGIVTNITNFGAFVDVGVKQDGLVHISHLANKFVSDPNEVIKLSQKVMVTVLEVDESRKRIALSMKEGADATDTSRPTKRNENERKQVNRPSAPLNPFQAKLMELKKKFE